MAASVLREDSNGSPRTLRLLASLVEAESRRFATAASEPAENDLVRAFRGGATPSVPIGKFLERLQRCFRLFDGSVYVYAGAYLTRFMRSPAACDAGIVLEPTTAHRLVSIAVLLGAKFISPRHYERRVETFEICSDRSIRRARCARSRSSSCAPSTTASPSASKNFSGSLGSWNEGRQLRRAADPGRGRRRRRRAERRSPAASGLAARPSWGRRVSS